MLAGLFVKNFKIFKQQRFVPLTNGHRLTAFVGPNGAGKSSVLEALDTYFNSSPWNVNKLAIKNAETTNFINLPYVAPLFVIPKDTWNDAVSQASDPSEDAVKTVSEYLWSVQPGAMSGSIGRASDFFTFRDELKDSIDADSHLLLISGVRYNIDRSKAYFGPFHQQRSLHEALDIEPTKADSQLDRSKENDEKIADVAGDINQSIFRIYDYIYIPADVNIADYTRLEQRNMLLLMGRDINKEIRKAITPEILDRINASLDETVERALENLDSYTYEKPKGGKKNITVRSLSGIITKEYFSIRELSKKDGNSVIPVSRGSVRTS